VREAALVECITCGAYAAWSCVNGREEAVSYLHLQRQLLWILRQTEPYSNLQIKTDPGYREEQERLRALRNARVRGELDEHREYIQTTAQRVTVMDLVGEMEDL
jgi:Na+-translocating ferredoxin:NAD+ oxidoreductase RnfC subunit